MMRLFRKKDGFTLVELLIVILTGTIVTAAATTILLLAMRINRKTLDTVERQSIMRIMQSVFEDMGSDGDYVFTDNAIVKKKENNEAGDPVISFKDGKIVAGKDGDSVLMDDVTKFLLSKTDTPFNYVRGLYTFSIETKGETYVSSVYGRAQDDDWFVNDPALDYEVGRNALVDIAASQIGSEGKIVEEVDRYYTEWYLDEYININIKENANKVPFYKSDEATAVWNPDIWSTKTPWCATFVSWALKQCSYVSIDTVDKIDFLYDLPQDASVNYLWMENFVLTDRTDQSHMKVNDATTGTYHTPLPGDLIFFEYFDPKENDGDTEYEPEDNPDAPVAERQNLNGLKTLRNDPKALDVAMLRERNGYYINVNDKSPNYKEIISPELYDLLTINKTEYVKYDVMEHYLGCVGDGLDHVGIVAKVEYELIEGVYTPTYVYTIEGNVRIKSGAIPKVTLCKHSVKNPDIFGYATLNWNEDYK